MKTVIVVFLLALLFGLTSFAISKETNLLVHAVSGNVGNELTETMVIDWNRTYVRGGAFDEARRVVQTSDGGYALAGESGWHEGASFWLVKTDHDGNIMWNKTYRGASFGAEAFSLVISDDGGFAIGGYSWQAGQNHIWLVKTDANGDMLWNKTYGGEGNDRAYSMIKTSDGGYALAGSTTSFGVGSVDGYLVKTDPEGNMVWNRTYGGGNWDDLGCVVQTSDGGYALAGQTSSYGADGMNFWLVRTDGTGEAQWSHTYGGMGRDWASSVVQTSDGGYALAGQTDSFGPSTDAWLLKTDASGNVQWNRTYGRDLQDGATALTLSSSGRYVLAGYESFPATGMDLWLAEIDADGTILCDVTCEGPGWDQALSVIQDSGGGYVAAGFWKPSNDPSAHSDFYLVHAHVATQLAASISPTSASVLVGQLVMFTSTVSGGQPPYSYQWYLGGSPVSGATSNTWVFTPIASGTYYVYVTVTDAEANTAQSETARIIVAAAPVGGYSIQTQVPAKAEPVLPYIALTAALTAIFTKLRPKTKRKR